MHVHDTAAAVLAAHFANNSYAHANAVAALVLERLPNGEHAWLRPSTDAGEDDDALHVPTQAGRDLLRRWRAERSLYGHEVSG